jgi:hypothetical protein
MDWINGANAKIDFNNGESRCPLPGPIPPIRQWCPECVWIECQEGRRWWADHANAESPIESHFPGGSTQKLQMWNSVILLVFFTFQKSPLSLVECVFIIDIIKCTLELIYYIFLVHYFHSIIILTSQFLNISFSFPSINLQCNFLFLSFFRLKDILTKEQEP